MSRRKIQTGRNPFSRETIVKRSVDDNCSWCGLRNKRGKVFQYTVIPDSGASSDIRGVFCSIDCLNDFHE